MNKNKLAYLKDKLQGWPDAMALTSKDVADLIGLIESSGGEKHPLVKLVENMVDMTPEQHRAANDCLRELIHGEPAPSPGPSANEVEEAMQRIRQAVGEAFLWRWNNRCIPETANTARAEDCAALAVIKAALSKQGPTDVKGVVFHAWKDGKWLGVVADSALSDRVFIAHIQSHLKEGEKVVCKICGRTAEEITGGQTVPTSGEREEMLEIIDSKMSALVSRYGWLRLGDLKRNESGNPINREYETLNKIRALILAPPVSVTREWVKETSRMVVVETNQISHDLHGQGIRQDLYDQLWNTINEYLLGQLREKGFVVGEKP